ncbi:MAG TPA: S41 family peptidase [Bacteroidales bacterium]|nr:S41 family peptidase [Bacteroidales bacterium]
MKVLIRLVCGVALLLALLTSGNILQAQARSDFEVAKNLEIFVNLYRELNKNYSEELNHGKLFEAAINAMLGELDPYTNFISEAQIEEFRFLATGQYGGIGAVIRQRDNFVIISEPYEGSPAHNAGLKAGDKILEVNGNSALNRTTNEVSMVLRGQPGTTLKLKVERENTEKPLEFTIRRENVKIPDIPYSTMLENEIAYINLAGFTHASAQEVIRKFNELRQKSEPKGLILDLRGNGGGLLNEAVDIVGMFVPKNEYVVGTRGKLPASNQNHFTRNQPVDTEIPLVILVDNHSASASEIVAGAIQDLDRGVIIGQTTLGKGLVQNVIPLVYNTHLKVTTAKYLIPSGRSIQAIDHFHRDENNAYIVIPDSLKTAFRTRNGRTVYEANGIEPDITIEPPQLSNIAGALYLNFMIFDFANRFAVLNSEIPPADEFIITEEIYADFKDFVKQQDFTYTTRTETLLNQLKEAAYEELYKPLLLDDIRQLENSISQQKKKEIITFADEIKELLRMEIVTRYYYQRGRIVASLKNDKAFGEAIELLRDNDRYRAMLQGND